MKSITSFILLGILLAFGSLHQAAAWEWPLDPDGFLREAVSFGSLQGGELAPGLVFESTQGKRVRAMQSGEIIYFSSGLGRRRSRVFQNPEGNLVLAHQNGLRSTYGGLKSLLLPGNDSYLAGNRLSFLSSLGTRELADLKARWTPSAPGELGVAGERFSFVVNDPSEDTLVNPWAFLPVDMGTELPRFVSFRLGVPGTDQVVQGFSWMEIPWKEVDFLVTCKDPWAMPDQEGSAEPARQSRMPRGSTLKRLELKRDGVVLASLDFRLLSAEPKTGRRVAVNEAHKVTTPSRLGANTYSLGRIKLHEGDNSLDLVVYNMAGKHKSWDLWVRLKSPPAPVVP